MIEAATGVGKTSISIRLVNHLLSNSYLVNSTNPINILILVAKRVHKQTWKEEVEKWGGIHHPTADINICMECYESLKNHCKEKWDIILADEVHHIGSEIRLDFLKTMSFGYFIGLSATIPRKLKQYFRYNYHSEIVSCDIVEAIADDILPEPQILLFPLILDNRHPTEEWEINAKARGPVYRGGYRDKWKYKRQKVHAILSCTQKQKCIEYDELVDYFKRNGRDQAKLYMAGKRLEFLADIKLPIIKDILSRLKDYRTITFCKTIEQAEQAGKWCIHSKNQNADWIYEAFNRKQIDHITAVNILNENANLVDCKYALFCNLSSSEISVPQRIGRSLRHPSPVIIIPFYKGTREEELVQNYIEGFKRENIKVIHSIQEI